MEKERGVLYINFKMAQKFCTNCGNALREGAKFCTACGVPISGVSSQSKEVLVSHQSTDKKTMTRRTKFIYGAIALGIAVTFFSVFTSSISVRPHPVIEKQQVVAMPALYTDQTYEQFSITSRVDNGKIIIPLPILLEKKMLEFEYDASTTVVPLLAYISNEGKLVTSIRFCEPCNSKTFRAEGKELVCGNCGTRWNLNNLAGISGTCQKYAPAPIPSEVVDGEIHIDEKLITNWKLRI